MEQKRCTQIIVLLLFSGPNKAKHLRSVRKQGGLSRRMLEQSTEPDITDITGATGSGIVFKLFAKNVSFFDRSYM